MFRIYDGRDKFYQWDTNVKLIVEDAAITEVHFCNRTKEESLVVEVYTEGALRLANVPNILLQNQWSICVYAFDTYYTKYEKKFEVVARSRPADYAYTETEVRTWNALEQEMDAAIAGLEEFESNIAANEESRQNAEQRRASEEGNRRNNEVAREARYYDLVNNTNELIQNNYRLQDDANYIIQRAFDSVTTADKATTNANDAAEGARTATNTANDAAGRANNAAGNAQDATSNANSAANAASYAANNAQGAADRANEATVNAQDATLNADKATDNANEAANRAYDAAQGINGKFANALKGAGKGETVVLYDTSTVDHEMKVNVKGKNLFDISKVPVITASNILCTISEVGENYIKIITPSNYTGNGYCPTTTKLREYCPQLKAGDKATLSFSKDNNNSTAHIYLNIPMMLWNNGTTVTITEDMLNSYIIFYGSTVSNDTVTISNIQIEINTNVTEYKPYIDTSTVKAKVLGKNFFDISKVPITESTDGNCSVIEVGASYIKIKSPNNYSGNGFCTLGAYLKDLCPQLKVGDKVTLFYSKDKSTANDFIYLTVNSFVWRNGKSIVVTEDALNSRVVLYGSTVSNDILTISNPQIEIGEVPTEYEQYIEPTEYAVNADGTVNNVYSIYPSTVLTTDTDGVVIEVEYNRDINKAFEELKNAILSLGGNV